MSAATSYYLETLEKFHKCSSFQFLPFKIRLIKNAFKVTVMIRDNICKMPGVQ